MRADRLLRLLQLLRRRAVDGVDSASPAAAAAAAAGAAKIDWRRDGQREGGGEAAVWRTRPDTQFTGCTHAASG